MKSDTKSVITIRSLRWPADQGAMLALDTSFTTERVYRVLHTDDAFTMHEESISPPLHKAYDLTREIELFPGLDSAFIAEHDQHIVGLAALENDSFNRRALIRHIYVDRAHRGLGIGRALIDALLMRAKTIHARCMWLETQDVNFYAIQFYEHMGFSWCGVDLSLDERHESPADETAIFFMRDLD